MSFATRYTTRAGDIRRALDAGDFATANGLVHDVKGLAGNLSALPLQAAAAELEKLVKYVGEKGPPDPEKLREAFAALEARLAQALRAAGSLVPRAGGPAAAPRRGTVAGCRPSWPGRPPPACARPRSWGTCRGWRRSPRKWPPAAPGFAPYRDRIARLADDFDFDGVLALADELGKTPA